MPSKNDKDRTTIPRPSQSPDKSQQVAVNNGADEWDEISESSWESFPASDPPSWAGQGSSRPRHQPIRNNKTPDY